MLGWPSLSQVETTCSQWPPRDTGSLMAEKSFKGLNNLPNQIHPLLDNLRVHLWWVCPSTYGSYPESLSGTRSCFLWIQSWDEGQVVKGASGLLLYSGHRRWCALHSWSASVFSSGHFHLSPSRRAPQTSTPSNQLPDDFLSIPKWFIGSFLLYFAISLTMVLISSSSTILAVVQNRALSLQER